MVALRLFIAINFNEQVKNEIHEVIKKVEKIASKGRFVKKEHMHLTLEFLGEIPPERVGELISVMKCIDVPPFILELAGLGYFTRRGGDVYWLGIKESKSLLVMQNNIHKLLMDKGFLLQEREYIPHITIGREVKLARPFEQDVLNSIISNIKIHVNSIELMKSERIKGRLVHQSVFSKFL